MNWTVNDELIESSMQRIAEELMLHHVLVVNTHRFRITEIEFYYYSPSHPDGYTHHHTLGPGRPRFHFGGIDLTLDSDNSDAFGGILVRSVIHLNSARAINGPRKVLYELLASIDDITDHNVLKLDPVSAGWENATLERTPRVGLNPEKAQRGMEDQTEYLNAKYRFVLKV